MGGEREGRVGSGRGRGAVMRSARVQDTPAERPRGSLPRPTSVTAQSAPGKGMQRGGATPQQRPTGPGVPAAGTPRGANTSPQQQQQRRRPAVGGVPAGTSQLRGTGMDVGMDRVREAEAKAEGYRVQLEELVTAAESLMEENRALAEAAAESAEAERKKSEQVQSLEHTVEMLRVLCEEGFGRNEEATRLKEAKIEFWDKIATKEVLARSKPPADYPIPRPRTVSTEDFMAMRQRLQQVEKELKEQTRRNAALEAQNVEVSTSQRVSEREAARAIAKQQSQLVGAVRRIHWLVEEQKVEQAKAKKLDRYVSKLENQLLRQNAELKKARHQLGATAQLTNPNSVILGRMRAPGSVPSSPRGGDGVAGGDDAMMRAQAITRMASLREHHFREDVNAHLERSGGRGGGEWGAEEGRSSGDEMGKSPEEGESPEARRERAGEGRGDEETGQSPDGGGGEEATEEDFTISEIEKFAARLTELADINSFKPSHG